MENAESTTVQQNSIIGLSINDDADNAFTTALGNAFDAALAKHTRSPEENVTIEAPDALQEPVTTLSVDCDPVNVTGASDVCLQDTASEVIDQTVITASDAVTAASDTPTVQDDYPDPEKVLQEVEERVKTPNKHKKSIKPPAFAINKSNNAFDSKKPAKNRAALFELSQDRPASQLLKQVFDPSTLGGVDGIDHINIHNDAKTPLGRFLDMNAHAPFVHPDAGAFRSVGGLWHYIQTRPLVEEYRVMTGSYLRTKVSRLREEARVNPDAPRHTIVKGFRTIVADAMWYKVTQNPKAVEWMDDSTLPFEHYFTQGDLNIRQYPSEGYWIVAAYEEIRRMIKLRLRNDDYSEQPDFSKIETMTDPRAGFQKPRVPVRRDSPYGQRQENPRSYFNQQR